MNLEKSCNVFLVKMALNHLEYSKFLCIFIFRPEKGIICLSRGDKNLFNRSSLSQYEFKRKNYNLELSKIINGSLHCYGNGESYLLDELCYDHFYHHKPYECTLHNGINLILNPR